MGQVSVAKDIMGPATGDVDKVIRIRVSPIATAQMTSIVDVVQAWVTNFMDSWSLRDGVRLSDDEMYARELDVTVGYVRQLPDGSVVFDVLKAPDVAAYKKIVGALVGTLEALEYNTSLELYRDYKPMLSQHGVRVTTTAVWVSPVLTQEAQRRPPGLHSSVPRVSRRDLPPETLRRVVEHAVRWCRLPNAQYFLSYDNVSREVDGGLVENELNAILAETATEVDAHVVLVAEDYPRRARMVSFTPTAELLYNDMLFEDSHFEPAPVALAVAQSILLDLAPVLAAGCALRGKHPAGIHNLLAPPAWPRRTDRPVGSLSAMRVLSSNWLLDAFPVVYLGPEFPELTESPNSYTTTRIGDGRLLITKAIDAWFAGITPDRATVDQARRELDELIIDDYNYTWLVRTAKERPGEEDSAP